LCIPATSWAADSGFGFRQIPSPSGVAATDISTSGSSWAVVSNGTVYLTTSGGATWSEPTSAPSGVTAVSYNPSGVLWAVAGGRALFRLDPGATGFAPVGLPNGTKWISAPVFDAGGVGHLAVAANGVAAVDEITSAGVVAPESASSQPCEPMQPVDAESLAAVVSLSGGIYARCVDSTDGQDTTYSESGSVLTATTAVPGYWQSANLVLGWPPDSGSISTDGGLTFPGGTYGMVPVFGDPGYIIYGRWALFDAQLFDTGVPLPFYPYYPTKAYATPTGWLVLDAAGKLWSAPPGQPPDTQRTYGPQTAASTAILDDINRDRASAGVSQVSSEAPLVQASSDHAHYCQLNTCTDQGSETPGLPGFTGTNPTQRCTAAGGYCDGDISVILHHITPSEAVSSIVNDPYNRRLLLGPSVSRVGGDIRGNVAVISTSDSSYTPAQASEYPRGVYKGPNELVEPTQYNVRSSCAHTHQRLDRTAGAAVTLIPSLSSHAMMTLTQANGRRVAGCFLNYGSEAIFVPVRMLSANTTYHVNYLFGNGQSNPPLQWSFTTGKGDGTLPPLAEARVGRLIVKHQVVSVKVTAVAGLASATGAASAGRGRRRFMHVRHRRHAFVLTARLTPGRWFVTIELKPQRGWRQDVLERQIRVR
jgi:hypothetical protein